MKTGRIVSSHNETGMRILVAEDDLRLQRSLVKALSENGYAVDAAADGEDALFKAESSDYDLVVLDVLMPLLDGWQVLERLRRSKRTPVLMLTARDATRDRVKGLDLGADDYLVKPFSFVELSARLRALGRRQHGAPTRLRYGGLELDLVGRVATVDGRRIALTPIEFSLLTALLQAQGEPVTRRQLLHDVWGYDFDPGTNVVDVHVNRVRRKLEDAGVADAVRTVRGRGYAAG